MRIVLIADAFPPMRTSAAVQLYDLAQEFVKQHHELTILVPSFEISEPYLIEAINGIEVLRIRAQPTKEIGYFRRTINEFLMPYFMYRRLGYSPVSKTKWDGVIWYSPSIFFGPLVRALKKDSNCRSYLILRDIFPEWAVNMGLMKPGFIHKIFKAVESYQYSVADVIGVQSAANLGYFEKKQPKLDCRIEVLQNWLAPFQIADCSISISSSILSGRKIFLYAGNMGVAQNLDVFLNLANRLRHRKDIGFMFVGRGSDAQRLENLAKELSLPNTIFRNEIAASEISGLYAQCHVGIVALDTRHKTHNIPGKFLSYMQGELPVLARINPGNDLAEMIRGNGVGRVSTNDSIEILQKLAEELVDEVLSDPDTLDRCRTLFKKHFSPEYTVKQIVASLEDGDPSIVACSAPQKRGCL